MVDWSGHDGTPTAKRYRQMAEHQVRGVSPTYERLCLGVADDPEMVGRLDTVPPPKRQPNLLLGAVRLLGGPIESYGAFRAFVLDRWDDVAAVLATRRTQTNEPRRCATLLPALAALPQPLALLEVGASAGLCLYPDRYAYRFGDRAPLGSSRLVLDCAVRGPVPVPNVLPQVVWRAGLDLNPLDVTDDADLRWLRALIWPEETDRYAVLDAAVALARRDPVAVQAGDLTRDLAAVAETAPDNATLVIFHSAVLAYVDEAGRAEFTRQVAAIAAQRPTAWLANEGPGVVTAVPRRDGSTPFVLARDGQALALTAPHGEWIEWLG